MLFAEEESGTTACHRPDVKKAKQKNRKLRHKKIFLVKIKIEILLFPH